MTENSKTNKHSLQQQRWGVVSAPQRGCKKEKITWVWVQVCERSKSSKETQITASDLLKSPNLWEEFELMRPHDRGHDTANFKMNDRLEK